MAKKKGRRSANIARKREKRKRDQKSRQKQLAAEKQRRLRHEKSEEEHLHACISQSRKLLDEPELEGILFDPELMYIRVMELLNNHKVGDPNMPTDISVPENPFFSPNISEEEIVIEGQSASTPEAEQACESFRLEVLPHLVTPEFMRQLGQALTACENRLKMIRDRKLAEVAYVTRTLFEAAPPEILAFHPMIQTIGIETLRVLVEEQDVIIEWREGVKEILSDVLEHDDLKTDASQQISAFSGSGVDNKHRQANENTEPVQLYSAAIETATEPQIARDLPDSRELKVAATTEPALDSETVINSESSSPEEVCRPPFLSADELPACALYKNFNGLAIKECFEEQTDGTSAQNGLLNYTLANESEDQVEFVDVENERYVRVTEERVQLHARSESELSIAMAEIEAQLTSALMYLAKTIEERG